MNNRLHVQNFLTGAGLVENTDGVVVAGNPLAGLEQLKTLFGINVKQHTVYPNLYHFSYDQLESPKGHPIVNECRGLILDSNENWEVVSFPFSRFANQGETWAAPIDWNDVRVQEKVDGSLMIVWFYAGKWNVSTKGSPEAGGQVGDFGFTFAQLFEQTLAKTGKQHSSGSSEIYIDYKYNGDLYGDGETVPEILVPGFTYMFELTSIYNRVVCQYGVDPQLTLIGVRNNETLEEIPVAQYADLKLFPLNRFDGIQVVKEYSLNSLSDIETAALALDPMQNEGFVVVDGNFNRVKIKSPSYVAIHHMKDGFGQRRIIRLIQLGETSEVLAYFPEYVDLFNEIKAKIDVMIDGLQAEYDRIKDIPVRKDFALEAQKSKNSGVLFSLYLGKGTNVRDLVLHSKKVVKKATATEDAVEDFAFAADKIEDMIGLKYKPEVVLD